MGRVRFSRCAPAALSAILALVGCRFGFDHPQTRDGGTDLGDTGGADTGGADQFVPTLASGDARLVFGQVAGSGIHAVAHRFDLQTRSWGAGVTENTQLAPIWVRGAGGAGEELILTQRWDGALLGSRITGGRWRVEWIDMDNLAQAPQLAHAVAYERQSGDGLAVYRVADGLRYRTCAGGTWSDATSFVLAPTGGVPRWLQLAAAPGSDEVAMAYTDSSGALVAALWDGAAWSQAEVLVSGLDTTWAERARSFDLAYESSSGRLMVAWIGGTGELFYRLRSPGQQFATASSVLLMADGDPYGVELEAAPTGGDIAAIVFDGAPTIWRVGSAIWRGGSGTWGGTPGQRTELTHQDTWTRGQRAAVAWLDADTVLLVAAIGPDAGRMSWWRVDGDTVGAEQALSYPASAPVSTLALASAGGTVLLAAADETGVLETFGFDPGTGSWMPQGQFLRLPAGWKPFDLWFAR